MMDHDHSSPESASSNRPTTMVGLGYRSAIGGWILSKPSEVECLEITAEHFFDGPDQLLVSLCNLYPVFVHGLGLSLGTPGPLHPETLSQFRRVVELSNPQWISEHVAFTRSDEVDLGHLNPIAPTESSLKVLVDHARELSDVCEKPLILENITSFLRLPGEMPETDFLNRLCQESGCGLLLDVTNLWVNSRNHRFDPVTWLDELQPPNLMQLHIVGYSYSQGVWKDSHGQPIQHELYDLAREVLKRFSVDAIIIERDVDLPSTDAFQNELRQLKEICCGPSADHTMENTEQSTRLEIT